MSDKIFVKDSEIKQFPSELHHPLAPILYAEKGIMPAATKDQKTCVIVVTMAGLYLLRPQFGRGYKISAFISTYDLIDIEKINETRRTLKSKHKSLFMVADHIDVAIGEILRSRALLFQHIDDANPIKVRGYMKSHDLQETKLNDISVRRYYCLSVATQSALEESLIDFFKQVDQNYSHVITIPSTVPLPEDPKALYVPICSLGNVYQVNFDNIAPDYVCHIAYKTLKHAINIRTVRFVNYTSMTPEQLRFDKFHGQTFAFGFINCKLPTDTWVRIFTQFEKLDCAIIKFQVKQCELTQEQYELIIMALARCRCFRTVEVLDIDGIVFDGFWKPNTPLLSSKVIELERFLTAYSLSSWNKPSVFCIPHFYNSFMLSEICLRGQDMSQQVEPFIIPPNLRTIDLANCQFTFAALRAFFISLASFNRHMNVSFANLNMPTAHWESFFDQIAEIPRSKIIYELDWSGNKIPEKYAQVLGEFLFKENPVRYLAIDYIFTASTLNILKLFLQSCDPKRLWGFSMRGNASANVNKLISSLFIILEEFTEITVIDISGQFITSEGFNKLGAFIQRRRIREVSVDSTSIESLDKFYELWESLLSVRHIKAVGRPFQDLERLHASPDDFKQNQFREAIKKLNLPSSRRIRDMYYGSRECQRGYFTEKVEEFHKIYPRILVEEESRDIYGILPDYPPEERPSLFASSDRDKHVHLEEIQQRTLLDPFFAPKIIPMQYVFFIPPILGDVAKKPGLLYKTEAKEQNEIEAVKFQKMMETMQYQGAKETLSRSVVVEEQHEQRVTVTQTRVEEVKVTQSVTVVKEEPKKPAPINIPPPQLMKEEPKSPPPSGAPPPPPPPPPPPAGGMKTVVKVTTTETTVEEKTEEKKYVPKAPPGGPQPIKLPEIPPRKPKAPEGGPQPVKVMPVLPPKEEKKEPVPMTPPLQAKPTESSDSYSYSFKHVNSPTAPPPPFIPSIPPPVSAPSAPQIVHVPEPTEKKNLPPPPKEAPPPPPKQIPPPVIAPPVVAPPPPAAAPPPVKEAPPPPKDPVIMDVEQYRKVMSIEPTPWRVDDPRNNPGYKPENAEAEADIKAAPKPEPPAPAPVPKAEPKFKEIHITILEMYGAPQPFRTFEDGPAYHITIPAPKKDRRKQLKEWNNERSGIPFSPISETPSMQDHTSARPPRMRIPLIPGDLDTLNVSVSSASSVSKPEAPQVYMYSNAERVHSFAAESYKPVQTVQMRKVEGEKKDVAPAVVRVEVLVIPTVPPPFEIPRIERDVAPAFRASSSSSQSPNAPNAPQVYMYSNTSRDAQSAQVSSAQGASSPRIDTVTPAAEQKVGPGQHSDVNVPASPGSSNDSIPTTIYRTTPPRVPLSSAGPSPVRRRPGPPEIIVLGPPSSW